MVVMLAAILVLSLAWDAVARRRELAEKLERGKGRK
jgi:hypothetical protein